MSYRRHQRALGLLADGNSVKCHECEHAAKT